MSRYVDVINSSRPIGSAIVRFCNHLNRDFGRSAILGHVGGTSNRLSCCIYVLSRSCSYVVDITVVCGFIDEMLTFLVFLNVRKD